MKRLYMTTDGSNDYSIRHFRYFDESELEKENKAAQSMTNGNIRWVIVKPSDLIV